MSQPPRIGDELPPLPAPSPPVTADLVIAPFVPRRCIEVDAECSPDDGERNWWGLSQNQFDGLQARAALSNANVSGCFAEDRVHEGGWAYVVFRPSGEVSVVVLHGPVRSTATGDCIKRRLSVARVKPFGGRSRIVDLRID